MATGGAQSIPGVTLHEAYRFEARDGDEPVEGFVCKALPGGLVGKQGSTAPPSASKPKRDAKRSSVQSRRRLQGTRCPASFVVSSSRSTKRGVKR